MSMYSNTKTSQSYPLQWCDIYYKRSSGIAQKVLFDDTSDAIEFEVLYEGRNFATKF
jgi:hypothetical protein